MLILFKSPRSDSEEEEGLWWSMVEALCRMAERSRRCVDGNGSSDDEDGEGLHLD